MRVGPSASVPARLQPVALLHIHQALSVNRHLVRLRMVVHLVVVCWVEQGTGGRRARMRCVAAERRERGSMGGERLSDGWGRCGGTAAAEAGRTHRRRRRSCGPCAAPRSPPPPSRTASRSRSPAAWQQRGANTLRARRFDAVWPVPTRREGAYQRTWFVAVQKDVK